MKKKCLSCFLVLLFLLAPSVYASPQSEGFRYYVTMSLDSGDVDEPLSNFPVLIHLSENCGINNFDAGPIFTEIGNAYNYTAYVDSDGNRLYFEVDYWNSSEKEAFIWVNVPSVSDSSNTTLTLWFDPWVDGSAYNSPEDVWDNNFVMVQHMNDETNSTILDSTSYDNDGTKKGANEPIEADGIIGKAQDLDYIDDYITVPHDASLNFTSDITLEAWINAEAFHSGVKQTIMSKQDAAGETYNLYFYGNNLYWRIKTGDGTKTISKIINPSVDTWYYLFASYEQDGAITLSINLQTTSDTYTGAILTNSNPLGIGCYDTTKTLLFDGLIDETRASNIARSDAWRDTSYETQRDHFITFGAPQIWSDTASRGEFIAAALVASLILIPLLTLIIFAAKRRH